VSGPPLPSATGIPAGQPCALPGNGSGPAPGQELTGPAVTDLTGGAVRGGFALDGGKFSIVAPPAGDVPRVSRALAECEVMAAIASDGEPFFAANSSGMAAGYGLVTVSADLPAGPWRTEYPGLTLPTPAPARYQHRLAWVVVFRVTDRDNCPGVSQTDAPSPDAAYTGYYYEVFIADAATGGAAITYDEAVPGQCNGPGLSAPGISIPVEMTSVRWKLDSQHPHRSHTRLTAYVPPCLAYDKQVGLGFGSDQVAVVAYGQVGASCGAPRPVTVQLKAVPQRQGRWPALLHVAIGPYLPGTGVSPL